MTPQLLCMKHISDTESEWKYVVQYSVHYS